MQECSKTTCSHTRNIPVTQNIKVATFADGTAAQTVGNMEERTTNLQCAISDIKAWIR